MATKIVGGLLFFLGLGFLVVAFFIYKKAESIEKQIFAAVVCNSGAVFLVGGAILADDSRK